MKKNKTTIIDRGNERGGFGQINNSSDINKIPVDEYREGKVNLLIYREGETIFLKKIGNKGERDVGLDAITITEDTKFEFNTRSRNKYYISQFFLESEQIKFVDKETNEEDNNPDYYANNKNKVSFLSIANDYKGTKIN